MNNKSFYYTLSLTAGSALPLAFAPFSLYPIALLSPAVLIFSWLKFHNDAKGSFLAGWLFGLGFFGVGVSWVYISIHTYGHASALLAAVITALFIAVLALFPACNGYLANKLCRKNSLAKILLFFPASWVLFEWARSWFLSGFPWLFLGYSQINSPLKNIAPILGVYGVSFAVVFTGAALAGLFAAKNNRAKAFIVSGIAILWFGSAGLKHIKWTTLQGEKAAVSLIQGNIPLEVKWDNQQIPEVLNTYRQLSSRHFQSRLIVWPEDAIPTLQSQVSPYLKEIEKEALTHKSTIISGIIYQPEKNKNYYNAMIAFGSSEGIYLKKHLVPFGEFLPFKPFLFWLLDHLRIPMSDFSPGPKQQPEFIAGGFKIAPFICYEITYPNLVLNYLPNAQLLVTISEDSWFGKSLASAQQLEISQMRSLETGRYQLVAANSGLTAIIGPDGNIEAKLPSFQQAVLTGEIQAMSGATPWVNYGHYLWLILALLLVLLGIFSCCL